MTVLSKWPGLLEQSPGSDPLKRGYRYRGLTLELGAVSPSDSKHTFRDFRLDENYPYQNGRDVQEHYDAYKSRTRGLHETNTLHDPYHGWVDGHRSDVSMGSKFRLMGNFSNRANYPVLSKFSAGTPRRTPRVDIVTGLLLRRQFYREIASPILARLLSESFPCIRWLRHERWHHVDQSQQSKFQKCKWKSGLCSTEIRGEMTAHFFFLHSLPQDDYQGPSADSPEPIRI